MTKKQKRMPENELNRAMNHLASMMEKAKLPAAITAVSNENWDYFYHISVAKFQKMDKTLFDMRLKNGSTDSPSPDPSAPIPDVTN